MSGDMHNEGCGGNREVPELPAYLIYVSQVNPADSETGNILDKSNSCFCKFADGP